MTANLRYRTTTCIAALALLGVWLVGCDDTTSTPRSTAESIDLSEIQQPPTHHDELGGQNSSWEEIPEIIRSITGTSYEKQLKQLYALTGIKLGYPQASLCLTDAEHEQYMLQTKQQWQEWWKTTGEPIFQEKQKHSQVDQAAFSMAWEFFNTEKEQPEDILPVWIPSTWALYVTYTNGDYLGREKEVWIIDRNASNARLTKLRGDYGQGDWSVNLKEFSDFTPEQADQVLKALCYLHRYAPAANEEVPENCLEGLYYPHATLHLRDGDNRVLWNSEGYTFCRSRPKYGDGDVGRTYYFLSSMFSDEGKWKEISEPESETLAPYRTFLTFSKPNFTSNAADIIQLFGQQGGHLEMQAMLQWADKQKIATNPQMNWETCAHDFGTDSKDSVIGFTRLDIQETLTEINKVGRRLEAKQESDRDAAPDVLETYRAQEKELQRFVTDMLALEKREKEEALQRYPQPLRDLIIADEHPDDSDLKHLSAAVQAIRNDPDPKLFTQLVQELHERTLRMRSLLNNILLNDLKVLDVKPWGDKQEAIAVGACIDALPLAEDDAKEDLVVTLLRVCGGGRIEFESMNGGRSVAVQLTKDGYTMSLGAASRPLSIEEAQNKLRRLYENSRAE